MSQKKLIKPNKRAMLFFFQDLSVSDEEFGSSMTMREIHSKFKGQPKPRSCRGTRM